MKTSGQIRTHRESGAADALSSASDVLSAGLAMGIFPEGTRSRRDEAPFLSEGKTGVARLAAAHPHAVVVPLALVGTREVMQPQHHKFPRLWRRFNVHAARGVTWLTWLASEKGGNQTPSSLLELSKSDEHEIRAELSRLYRQFTDQLMGTLAASGAP